MSNTSKELKRMCEGIAEGLKAYYEGEITATEEDYNHEEGEVLSLWDYFADGEVLDIEYTIGSDKSFRGVRLLVAFGGPNIYIDTMHKAVMGYWWGDRAEAWLPKEICDEIDEIWKEFYMCS